MHVLVNGVPGNSVYWENTGQNWMCAQGRGPGGFQLQGLPLVPSIEWLTPGTLHPDTSAPYKPKVSPGGWDPVAFQSI